MSLNDIPLFYTMNQRLNYLGERQRVLAQNIANANTPNYQARDMRNGDFAKALGRETHSSPVQVAVTNVNHLQPLHHPSTYAIDKQKNPYETKPDGNGVILEEQMMKLAQNQGEYSTTSTLYGKYLRMMKMALGGAA
ncbi:MAG: flagellar basal body rod protein FlgB [Candidatus Pacebacteria bacterium]|nr:flagellar basal body rod protein FlgB [Candidatus Paceibacterota bacterium]